MDTAAFKEIVEKEVAKKIAMHKPFTYYDLEQSILSYLPNSGVNRYDVKIMCYEIFDAGTFPTWNNDWSKTLCDMNSSEAKVFVLHPDDMNPQDYIDEIDPFAKVVDVVLGAMGAGDDVADLKADINTLVELIDELVLASESVTNAGITTVGACIDGLSNTMEDVQNSSVYQKWS